MLVNFQINPGVAQGGGAEIIPPTDLAGAIAADAGFIDKDHFGRCKTICSSVSLTIVPIAVQAKIRNGNDGLSIAACSAYLTQHDDTASHPY